MFGLGMPELLVILVIVLVLFGAKRLPELGQGLGGFIHGLRSSLQGESRAEGEQGDDKAATKPDEKRAS